VADPPVVEVRANCQLPVMPAGAGVELDGVLAPQPARQNAAARIANA
jgi:hypothetical protein